MLCRLSPRWLVPLTLVVLLLPACSDSADDVAATTVAPSETATTEGVSAEIEQEITDLIDAWLMAWNDGDGQAAVDLFTDDGRYVSFRYTAPGYEALDGLSGEVLKAQIDREPPGVAARSGDPLIIVRDNSSQGRPDSYRVAQDHRPDGEYGDEILYLYNIGDEDGTLKFRYVESWSELGWYRLTEDEPYRGNFSGE
jgi:hypothetical protein